MSHMRRTGASLCSRMASSGQGRLARCVRTCATWATHTAVAPPSGAVARLCAAHGTVCAYMLRRVWWCGRGGAVGLVRLCTATFADARTLLPNIVARPRRRQTVYINALQTLPGFLKSAGERLGGLHAQRLFNADGNEVDDLMLVDDGDMLFVSCGEDFQPYHHNGNGRRAGDGSDGGRSHGAGYGKSGAGRIDHIGGYRLVAYLGRGAYGRVYKGVHQLTGQPVAIKFISKLSMGNVGDAERISTEIHCLETLHHRSVIKLYQVLNTDRAVALVFEYAGGGDLRQKVRVWVGVGSHTTLVVYCACVGVSVVRVVLTNHACVRCWCGLVSGEDGEASARGGGGTFVCQHPGWCHVRC